MPPRLTHGAGMLGRHTGFGPRARHKLQNNLFPVTHSWGPASTPAPLTLVVVAQFLGPSPPKPSGGSSARGMNASGSSGSRLRIGKVQEQEGRGCWLQGSPLEAVS